MRIVVVAMDSHYLCSDPLKGVMRDLQLKVGSDPPGHGIRHLTFVSKVIGDGAGN